MLSCNGRPMNLPRLFSIAERLRIEAIGDPSWIAEKETFEYTRRSVEVVAVLKAVRAAQGIKSLYLLCENGLFIDMGAIYRCVTDCEAEVYFLLEDYPNTSGTVGKFVKSFFETTMDGHLNTETEHVPTGKIHSAMVRVLTGLKQDEETKNMILRIYKTFCGYTHANYSHIMQVYGGVTPNLSFNIAGVPSVQQREMHMQLVKEASRSVLFSIGYIAKRLGLHGLHQEVLDFRGHL